MPRGDLCCLAVAGSRIGRWPGDVLTYCLSGGNQTILRDGKVREEVWEARERGVPQAFLDQIHTPIGLDIGAETPQEIALSILAEIVTVQRKGRVQ